MDLIIEKLIIPAILTILGALLSYATYLLKESKKTNDANAAGTMLLLRRQIIADHDKYCKGGEIMTNFDYSDIVEIHNAYKALGGNGLTDKLYEDLQRVNLAAEE